VLPEMRSTFAKYVEAHALSTSSDHGDGHPGVPTRVMLVVGADLPNGPVRGTLPQPWRDAIATILCGARSDLQSSAKVGGTILHFRVGDRLSFGFQFQRENVPADDSAILARCESLIREHSAIEPIHAMTDCADLLVHLDTAAMPENVTFSTGDDHTPVHCRAASAVHTASLDATIRDALTLMNADRVVGYSTYDHGSLFVRLLVQAGVGSSEHRPLFSSARHRCAGTCGAAVGSTKRQIAKQRRCRRTSPAFVVVPHGESWFCTDHRS
jgi:hypothetical protein